MKLSLATIITCASLCLGCEENPKNSPPPSAEPPTTRTAPAPEPPSSPPPPPRKPSGEARWTALSADEQVWVVATEHGEVWRWKLDEGVVENLDVPPEFVGSSGDVSKDGGAIASLKLNPDPRPFMTAERAAYVLRRDVGTRFDFANGARSIQVSGTRLFAKGSAGVMTYDLESGEPLELFKLGSNFSPDTVYVVEDRGSSMRNRDHRKLAVHAYESREHLFDVGPGTTCAFSSDSRRIACLEYPTKRGEELVVRNLPEGKRLSSVSVYSPRDEVVSDVSRDGRYVSTRKGIYDLNDAKLHLYSDDGVSRHHALLSNGRAVTYRKADTTVVELAPLPETDIPAPP